MYGWKTTNKKDNWQVTKKKLSNFVSPKTKKLFDVLQLDTQFLKEDPSTWETNQSYNGYAAKEALPKQLIKH